MSGKTFREPSDFWDRIAQTYDALYTTSWSFRENAELANWLYDAFSDASFTNFIDIGCGTGLGFDLLKAIKPTFGYLGVDASQPMLDRFQAKNPNVIDTSRHRLLCADANSILLSVPPGGFDAVLMLNGVASYLRSPQYPIRLAATLLRPGGRAFLSYYNKFSLRRSPWCLREPFELFGTRGAVIPSPVNAWVVTTSELARRSVRCGLEIRATHFQSVLGGVWERPAALRMESMLRTFASRLGHTVSITVEKPNVIRK